MCNEIQCFILNNIQFLFNICLKPTGSDLIKNFIKRGGVTSYKAWGCDLL